MRGAPGAAAAISVGGQGAERGNSWPSPAPDRSEALGYHAGGLTGRTQTTASSFERTEYLEAR